MTTQIHLSHLEIIKPDGDIVFVALGAGPVNIGRHASNEVVIDSPDVSQFQAMLDPRGEHCTLLLFAGGSGASIDGRSLVSGTPEPLAPWQAVRMNGHTLMLVATEVDETAANAAAGTTSVEANEAKTVPGTTELVLKNEEGVVKNRWDIEAGKELKILAVITNRWLQVQRFGIAINFVASKDAAKWIDQPSLATTRNLSPNEQATIEIVFRPPRLPSSHAGEHAFTVTAFVLSPDEQHKTRESEKVPGALNIAPFYELGEFAIGQGEIRVPQLKSEGTAHVVLTNKSNAPIDVTLAAKDAQMPCLVQYAKTDDKGHALEAPKTEPALFNIAAGQKLSASVYVKPFHRSILPGRPKLYSNEIVASVVGHDDVSRSARIKVVNPPRLWVFGVILASVVSLFVVWVWLSLPHIQPPLRSVELIPGGGTPKSASLGYINLAVPLPGTECQKDRCEIRIPISGPVTVTWQISNGAEVSLQQLDPDQPSVPVLLKDGKYERKFDVNGVSSYRLIAKHPFAKLPLINSLSQSVFVDTYDLVLISNGAKPDDPGGFWSVSTADSSIVLTADAKPTFNVPLGMTVTVFWRDVDAAKLAILANDKPIVIPDSEIKLGQRTFTIDGSVVFRMNATKKPDDSQASKDLLLGDLSGATAKRLSDKSITSVQIDALPPPPTPAPPPQITKFEISPTETLPGAQVILEWSITGATSATLAFDGIVAEVPLNGIIYQRPAPPDTPGDYVRIYQLTAYNGNTPVMMTEQLRVLQPPPLPTPAPKFMGPPYYDQYCQAQNKRHSELLFWPEYKTKHRSGSEWFWQCFGEAWIDVTDLACKAEYGEGAFAQVVGKPEDKGAWQCWK